LTPSALKGVFPVNNWNAITPSDHKSEAKVEGSLFTTSGGM
jgi:hypothetical protein